MDERSRRRDRLRRLIQEEDEPELSFANPGEVRLNINSSSNGVRRWRFQRNRHLMQDSMSHLASDLDEDEEPEFRSEDSFDYGVVFTAFETEDDHELTKKVKERRRDMGRLGERYADLWSDGVDDDKTHEPIIWRFHLDGPECGVYNVVLGICVGSMNYVESITVTITNYGTSFGPSETIARNELKALVKHPKEITKWKLHQQLRKSRLNDAKMVVMEIRTSVDAPPTINEGLYSVEFMELHPAHLESDQDEPSLVVHQPFIQSLNIIRKNRKWTEAKSGSNGNPQANNHTQSSSDLPSNGIVPSDSNTQPSGDPQSNNQPISAQVPQSDINTAMLPSKIISYSISGNGMHIATLAISETFTYDGADKRLLFLDLWDLNSAFTKHQRTKHSRQSPLDTQPSAGFSCILPALRDGAPDDIFGVSLSWDGTQIALTDNSAFCRSEHDISPSMFAVFKFRKSPTPSSPPHATPATPTVIFNLDISDVPRYCVRLENFYGCGKFHITALTEQRVQNELFISCDGFQVRIHKTFRVWEHLRVIPLNNTGLTPPTMATVSFGLIRSLHGKYCIRFDQEDDVVTIWDVNTATMASVIKLVISSISNSTQLNVGFSKDGTMLAIHREGVITTYWSATGTMLGATKLPTQPNSISDIQFIRDDKQIILNADVVERTYGRGRLGFILDATTLNVMGRFLVPGNYLMQQSPNAGIDQKLFSAHGTIIDVIRLQDRILEPHSEPARPRGARGSLKAPLKSSQDSPSRRSECDSECEERRLPLRDRPRVFNSQNRIKFTIEIHPAPVWSYGSDNRSPSLVVYASRNGGPNSEILVIPSIQDPLHRLQDMSGVFLEDSSCLVVESQDFIMVWGLPATIKDRPRLLLAWRVPKDENEFSWEGKHGLWYTCEHQQLFACRKYIDYNSESPKEKVVCCPRVERSLSEDTFKNFLEGVLVLIDIFKNADETCGDAILQYVGSQINAYPAWNAHTTLYSEHDFPENVLLFICEKWRASSHDSFEKFTAALLQSPFGRWVPKDTVDRELDPLFILLKQAPTEPLILGLMEIIIAYFIRQAKSDKDTLFLLPVKRSLSIILNQTRPHSDLALRMLRGLAFVPVKSRSLIIDNHTIAHPPELRLLFWRPNSRPLYECKEPVLQFAQNSQGHDAQNDKFTPDLFVTSFELLWDKVEANENRKNVRRTLSRLFRLCCLVCRRYRRHKPSTEITEPEPSWFDTVLYMTWDKFKLTSKAMIECHDFTLEMFDNPAIAALIEYKWSVYNIVDIAAFGLPLAASINYLLIRSGWITGATPKDGNAGFLSFSAILIALHFAFLSPHKQLFELRVNEMVCKYVTIIIRIINEIRVFFFIFFGGILAFTIATWHLLRSCPFETCSSEGPVDFPSNFFLAMSATYFVMGGRYNAVDNDFGSKNWAFHFLMIVYFFFTVILMLNVLISLINVAFNVGDENWRMVWLENRLRFVEGAENLTHHIPGFRKTHQDWFPKEIYYSATPQQVNAYTDKYFSSSDKYNTGGDYAWKVREKETGRVIVMNVQGSESPAAKLDSDQIPKSLKNEISRVFAMDVYGSAPSTTAPDATVAVAEATAIPDAAQANAFVFSQEDAAIAHPSLVRKRSATIPPHNSSLLHRPSINSPMIMSTTTAAAVASHEQRLRELQQSLNVHEQQYLKQTQIVEDLGHLKEELRNELLETRELKQKLSELLMRSQDINEKYQKRLEEQMLSFGGQNIGLQEQLKGLLKGELEVLRKELRGNV
ncbi:hypothetical protein BGZ50_009056 [Haplosporangium sp. Z 11]|nr:hypothetical protein BGZ50_009056 [Haplosporangium sp. Z 11]